MSEKIISRPHWSIWLLIAFGAAAAVGFPLMIAVPAPGKNPLPWSVAVAVGAVLLVPVLWGAVWAGVSRITADKNGLRWRNLRGNHFSPWHEILDYYDTLRPAGGKSSPRIIVEYENGTSLVFSRDWTKVDNLRRVVQQNACNAKTAQWQTKGTRPCDNWPHVFHYKTADNKLHRVLVAALFMLGLGMYTGQVIPGALRTWATLGAGWGLGTLAIGLIVPLLCAAMALIHVPFLRDTKQREKQRITASLSGLSFENGKSISADWGDIRSYSTDYGETKKRPINISRYVIETAQGQITFGYQIHERNLLCEIVSQYATKADTKAWAVKPELLQVERIGGEGALWTGGVVGVGERVYHYRSRITRALLWILYAFAAMCLAGPAFLALDLVSRKQNGSVSTPFVLSAGFLAVGLWATWRYFAARIVVSGAGIMQYTVLGRRFVRWADVTDFYESGEDVLFFGNVVGQNREKVRFWLGMDNANELKNVIVKRVPRPPKTGWKADTHN